MTDVAPAATTAAKNTVEIARLRQELQAVQAETAALSDANEQQHRLMDEELATIQEEIARLHKDASGGTQRLTAAEARLRSKQAELLQLEQDIAVLHGAIIKAQKTDAALSGYLECVHPGLHIS